MHFLYTYIYAFPAFKHFLHAFPSSSHFLHAFPTSVLFLHPCISCILAFLASLHFLHPHISYILAFFASLHFLHPYISYIRAFHASMHFLHAFIKFLHPCISFMHLCIPVHFSSKPCVAMNPCPLEAVDLFTASRIATVAFGDAETYLLQFFYILCCFSRISVLRSQNTHKLSFRGHNLFCLK